MIYPIGIQNFESLRKEGYVYVDKTDLVYSLVKTGRYYFLSRPRRFGKSLLVSTLESYFKGKRELFEGLAIESLEKDWIEYPVLHIDLGGVDYSRESALSDRLSSTLCIWEEQYGVDNQWTDFGVRFGNVIDAASRKTGRKVVILIDEYDKPIVDNLGNEELQNVFRRQLQGFYSMMKSKDGNIKFGFLTGVTKIGKLSIFSGLNNLIDISMDAAYVDICGISEKDLRTYFAASVCELATSNGISEAGCYNKLAEMYDGYHFCENSVGIYNPFSLLNTFRGQKFKEYWFETGTPSFLVEVMKKTSFDVTTLSEQEADSTLLSSVESIFYNPVPLLYQSGYLTIKGYDSEFGLYTLGFPNKEVKNGFLGYLLKYYVSLESSSGQSLISRLTRDIRSGKPEGFMRTLEAMFARTPYQIQGDSEKDFQYAMYIIFELLGEYVEAERQTSNGRIDILLRTKDYIYIIEVKIDDTADAALAQIDGVGYDRPFADDPRKLYRIGVQFSTATRRIEQWKVR